MGAGAVGCGRNGCNSCGDVEGMVKIGDGWGVRVTTVRCLVHVRVGEQGPQARDREVGAQDLVPHQKVVKGRPDVGARAHDKDVRLEGAHIVKQHTT